MNSTQNSELLDNMLAELDRARLSKQRQIALISDIYEKSNNILLQIEASQKARLSPGDNATRFKYCKETLHSLAKIVETFECLMKKESTVSQPCADFESFITATKSKIDFLGSSARKVLALNDTVNQIGSELRNDSDFEFDSSDTTGEGDPNSSE